MDTVSIGKLARELGLGAGTLRYYERLGLLSPAQRACAEAQLSRKLADADGAHQRPIPLEERESV